MCLVSRSWYKPCFNIFLKVLIAKAGSTEEIEIDIWNTLRTNPLNVSETDKLKQHALAKHFEVFYLYKPEKMERLISFSWNDKCKYFPRFAYKKDNQRSRLGFYSTQTNFLSLENLINFHLCGGSRHSCHVISSTWLRWPSLSREVKRNITGYFVRQNIDSI